MTDTITDRYQEWGGASHRDYRPSDAHRCPRVVVGRRCIAWTTTRWPGAPCICQQYSSILDHPRIWLTPAGDHVLTAEPYGLEGDHLAEFIQACAALGAEVWLEGYSPYNPGSTLLVTVRRAD